MATKGYFMEIQTEVKDGNDNNSLKNKKIFRRKPRMQKVVPRSG